MQSSSLQLHRARAGARVIRDGFIPVMRMRDPFDDTSLLIQSSDCLPATPNTQLRRGLNRVERRNSPPAGRMPACLLACQSRHYSAAAPHLVRKTKNGPVALHR